MPSIFSATVIMAPKRQMVSASVSIHISQKLLGFLKIAVNNFRHYFTYYVSQESRRQNECESCNNNFWVCVRAHTSRHGNNDGKNFDSLIQNVKYGENQ